MKSKIKFSGLHNHTNASCGDAIDAAPEHMDFALENGLDAHAFTDHGNMNNVSYSYLHRKKLNKNGKDIKIINGIEAYFVPSIKDWKELKEKLKQDAKNKIKDDIEETTIIEDENETKSDNKNILNKRSHLILLAQNETGYKNLCKLTSQSYQGDNFYRNPRIDLDLLKKYNSGLIVTSACLGGFNSTFTDFFNKDVDRKIVKDKQRKLIDQFVSIFGDRFFLELQWNAIPEQHELNQMLIELAAEKDIKLVSTADCHYSRPELWKDREIYKKLAWLGKGGYDSGPIPDSIEDMKYELYPKNGDQMFEAFHKYSKLCGISYDEQLILDSIERTYKIAHEMVDDYKLDTTIKIPDFMVPHGKTSDEYLKDLAFRGLKEKKLHLDKKYQDQLEFELNVISTRKMSEYFLVTKELVDFAHDSNQFTGSGRGSASGCLLSYVIGITQIDPLKYGLYFERFLTIDDPTSYPDIDIDFEQPAQLKKELQSSWKEKHNIDVIPISNFNKLKMKNLVKDLSKFNDVPFVEANEVTNKMMEEATGPAKLKNNIESGAYEPNYDECVEFSETFRKFLKKYPKISEHLKTLQGQNRNLSTHAAGCVIGENLEERLPLIASKGTLQTPFAEGQNVRHLEPLGFLKTDVLGLETLRTIHGCIERILKKSGNQSPSFEQVKDYMDSNLHPDVINFNDQKVYRNVFHDGNMPNIFQFTQVGVQEFCKQAKPKSLLDLSAVTAIYRPGPLAANVDKHYLEALSNKNKIKYAHPALKEVLGETFGLIVYQEQIAGVAHKLGKDISLAEGNKLRKILIKRGVGDKNAERDKIYSKFLTGCLEKGLSQYQAQNIWEEFMKHVQYSFNKSHSLSYAAISFQCGWLFTYFPEEWLASYLDKEDDDKKEHAISIVKSLGYTIKPPDINNSDGAGWQILNDKSFVQPLLGIKGLGEKAIEQIVNNRPYKNIEELIFNENITYSKLNKKCIDVLVRSQTLNSLMDSRFTGLKHFWTCVAVDRPKDIKHFEKSIELYKEEGDFSNEEKIEYTTSLLGTYPMDLIVSQKMIDKFKELSIPPLGEFDEKLGITWFVPRVVEERKTKTNKSYLVIKATDSTNKITEIKCWSFNPTLDSVCINKAYISKLDYDPKWGLSTKSIRNNFKKVTK